MNQKMQVLIERMLLANKNRFGSSSKKLKIENQICFKEVDGNIVFFNEAEAVCSLDAEELDDLEIKPACKPTTVGEKADDMVNIINHYLSEEELISEF